MQLKDLPLLHFIAPFAVLVYYSTFGIG